jgi:hypothetical protein
MVKSPGLQTAAAVQQTPPLLPLVVAPLVVPVPVAVPVLVELEELEPVEPPAPVPLPPPSLVVAPPHAKTSATNVAAVAALPASLGFSTERKL